MTLSEELAWRGFTNQTTYKDPVALDGDPITFYWGVDPSSDSMTIGNLAIAMMVKAFMKHGHKPVLLVGGATGLIGDPDGKSQERTLKTRRQIARNAKAISSQYKQLFGHSNFELVNNNDWFSNVHYISFLRNFGKHIPMREMLGRDFVETRLNDRTKGISYAEFSYALIQAYDFYYLYKYKDVTLQICGSDQWGNSIAGVNLIRRKLGEEVHIYSAPLVINKSTGEKFGKSEDGAIWLDATKTTPTQFYQFWMNVSDAEAGSYLKIFTELDKNTIDNIMGMHGNNPGGREAQKNLARAVTEIVHGEMEMRRAEAVTEVITGKMPIGKAGEETLHAIRKEIYATSTTTLGSVIEALVSTKLAASNSEARRLIASNAVSVNGQKISRENFEPADFQHARLLLRRGKAFKDSALVELGE